MDIFETTSKISDEITEKIVSDPNPLPKVLGWNILVRPVPIREVTQGGLYLADRTKEDMRYLSTIGRVLAIGPEAYKDRDGKQLDPWVKVGDYIAYAKNAGQRFKYKGVELILLSEHLPLFTVEDPEYLDTVYTLSN